MNRLLGSALVSGLLFAGLPALAQAPMSPIFPATPTRPPQPAVVKPASVATPSAAVAEPASRPGEGEPVATAIIPPPSLPPAADDKTEAKKEAAQSKTAAAKPVGGAVQRVVKARKSGARRSRYARRYHVPRYFPWAYASAELAGWGGGRFGPSPNGSRGQ